MPFLIPAAPKDPDPYTMLEQFRVRLVNTFHGTRITRTKALNASAALDSASSFLIVDSTTADVSLLLPNAQDFTNDTFVIKKKVAANTVHIVPRNSALIDGTTTLDLTSLNAAVVLVSDGLNWWTETQQVEAQGNTFTNIVVGTATGSTIAVNVFSDATSAPGLVSRSTAYYAALFFNINDAGTDLANAANIALVAQSVYSNAGYFQQGGTPGSPGGILSANSVYPALFVTRVVEDLNGFDYTAPLLRLDNTTLSTGDLLDVITLGNLGTGVTVARMKNDGRLGLSMANVGHVDPDPLYTLDVRGGSSVAARFSGNTAASSNATQVRFAGQKDGELFAIGTDIALANGSKVFHVYDLQQDYAVLAVSGTAQSFTALNGSTNAANILTRIPANGTAQQLGLAVEIAGGAIGTTNGRIAGYFGAQTGGSAGNYIWGLNIITQVNASAANAQSIGIELNVNNNNTHDASNLTGLLHYGYSAVSDGSKIAGIALAVGGAAQWRRGVRIDQGSIATGGFPFQYKGDGSGGSGGQVNITANGQLQLGFEATGLGNPGDILLYNNRFIQALDQTLTTLIPMISVTTADKISIDPFAHGTVFGGSITLPTGLVSIGAADSAGAGFRLLRVPN